MDEPFGNQKREGVLKRVGEINASARRWAVEKGIALKRLFRKVDPLETVEVHQPLEVDLESGIRRTVGYEVFERSFALPNRQIVTLLIFGDPKMLEEWEASSRLR
jgi:hypothetical protein